MNMQIKRSDLEFLFKCLGIDFQEFLTFMIGQTFSTINGEEHFNKRDIRNFFSRKKILVI